MLVERILLNNLMEALRLDNETIGIETPGDSFVQQGHSFSLSVAFGPKIGMNRTFRFRPRDCHCGIPFPPRMAFNFVPISAMRMGPTEN